MQLNGWRFHQEREETFLSSAEWVRSLRSNKSHKSKCPGSPTVLAQIIQMRDRRPYREPLLRLGGCLPRRAVQRPGQMRGDFICVGVRVFPKDLADLVQSPLVVAPDLMNTLFQGLV